jgi:hypothetical protein
LSTRISIHAHFEYHNSPTRVLLSSSKKVQSFLTVFGDFPHFPSKRLTLHKSLVLWAWRDDLTRVFVDHCAAKRFKVNHLATPVRESLYYAP